MKTRLRITRTSPFEALEMGFARLADITGSALVSPTVDDNPGQSDAAAIASDWLHVGSDLRKACRKADKQGLAK